VSVPNSKAVLGGILVCGGRSRRMGEDKALLRVDGRTLLERTSGLLKATCTEWVLACGPVPRYMELGWPLALDAEHDMGPLAGIAAGLAQLNTSHAMVIACDMPSLSTELLTGLFAAACEQNLDVCYLATGEHVEPLCAVYSKDCLPAIQAALESGKRRVTSFLEVQGIGTELRVGQVPLELLSSDAQCARNLNTPADLADLRGIEYPPTGGSQ
jgi:molybdopterin-guanine dinucleotide biosynthesis protein A